MKRDRGKRREGEEKRWGVKPATGREGSGRREAAAGAGGSDAAAAARDCPRPPLRPPAARAADLPLIIVCSGEQTFILQSSVEYTYSSFFF